MEVKCVISCRMSTAVKMFNHAKWIRGWKTRELRTHRQLFSNTVKLEGLSSSVTSVVIVASV